MDLIRKQRAQESKAAESPTIERKSTKSQSKERIVHFLKEQSLGRLLIQDINAVRNFQTFFIGQEQEIQNGNTSLRHKGMLKS